MIVVPLRVHGNVVGSLNLTRLGGPETHFTEHEFELCKLFAGQASIALQNAEAHVTMATRADLDALTGLRNHGTFQRDLSSVIEAGKPFSLLMMDLDSFKAFNDAYGHPAGDTLLEVVAKAIVTQRRSLLVSASPFVRASGHLPSAAWGSTSAHPSGPLTGRPMGERTRHSWRQPTRPCTGRSGFGATPVQPEPRPWSPLARAGPASTPWWKPPATWLAQRHARR